MNRVVRFERWGGPDVLEVVDVPAREPGRGEVSVTVRAAGITAGESAAREGALAQLYPMAFPTATGSEFAGVVTATGPGARFGVGDEVLGWSPEHAGHAETVVVPETALVVKPEAVSWEVAGALYVAGVTAWTCVESTKVRDGDVVLVVGAASDVGTLAVQLARLCGAAVVGVADPVHHDWLHAHGADAVAPADAGALARVVHERAGRVDVILDTTGADVEHLAEALGVPAQRCVATLPLEADLEFGGGGPQRADVLAELVDLVAGDRLHVPIAGVFPLADVVEAFATAERPHRQGRIVLLP
ncbi:NADP-dependent oxidoreductase [Kineococcus rhizosphaerae]|uniref:NADPH:quinone reductase-like Zn-dependent oxidoreductase n=1 Tax=Kineococcus rhizosphaerae TaxID=559628 RepID=A0A2T0RBH6_9ACTN|nr:NADP-dependent oxidoreductase [Kineococcus rhizosphaerae]PRY18512.1 NADPH:quinone reductase-like Zn-dependent oxidoreductase [Kineococcus rhizosphaerae]